MIRSSSRRLISLLEKSSSFISAAFSPALHSPAQNMASSSLLPICNSEICNLFSFSKNVAKETSQLYSSSAFSRVFRPSYMVVMAGAKSAPRNVRSVATSADSALVKALKAEIKHEEETYEAPQEIKNGPPSPFTLEERKGAAEIILRRTFQGEDIAVVASVSEVEEDEGSAPYEGEEEDEDEQDDVEPVGEELEIPEKIVPVRVTISKDGDKPPLEIDCMLSGSNWLIQSVRLESDDQTDVSFPYTGPLYEVLDPKLQEQFEEYLKRRGFNEDLGLYLQQTIDHKEQREYVLWLQRLAKFVGTK